MKTKLLQADNAAKDKRIEELEDKLKLSVPIDTYRQTVEDFAARGIEIADLQAELATHNHSHLAKDHCLHILAECTADLWHAIAGGMYDARSFVGDTVLPMQESLLEIGIDIREKPLVTFAAITLPELKKATSLPDCVRQEHQEKGWVKCKLKKGKKPDGVYCDKRCTCPEPKEIKDAPKQRSTMCKGEKCLEFLNQPCGKKCDKPEKASTKYKGK